MGRPSILVNALSVTHGGGRTYVLNLIRELDAADRGFDFTLLVPPGEFADLSLERVRMQPVGLPDVPGPLRLVSRIVYEELGLPWRARGHDLLYCLADVVPPLCPIPVVVALVNLNIYDRSSYDNLRLRTLNALVRLGLWRARKVIFPTRAAADQIGALVGVTEERVAIVPHGIDAAPFASAAAHESTARYLFTAAALERHKNLGVLVESLLHVGDPELEVWLAGPDHTDPAYAAELREQARDLGLAERVRFLGSVPYEQILGYYRGAVAMVFPSLLETFGLPVLEAMLAGAPIVASDIPTFREVAGEAALYFPETDPRSLAGCVDRIVADPEAAARRAEIGRSRVPNYSWKSSVDALCGVFEAALTASR